MNDNDQERALWVMNHEPLWLEYCRWEREGFRGGMRRFVREHREHIDSVRKG